MLRLLVTHGSEEQVFAVPEGEARLGSASDNDIVLRIRGVSRRHAVVRRWPGGVEVLDVGSKNRLFVEGQRVIRAVLTPGLRVQIGMAWLELGEVHSSETALALLVQSSEGAEGCPPSWTASVTAKEDSRDLSRTDAALALAFHVGEAGVRLPGSRADLLARIKATLGADVLMTFEREERGKLRVFEQDGALLPKESKLISTLIDMRTSFPGQVVVKQAGHLLLAGRDSWFLGARFAEESLAREGWRKDLLRFLAHRFFLPVRNLEEFEASEVRRVVALTGGRRRRAAKLLGISPGKLYKHLNGSSPAKR